MINHIILENYQSHKKTSLVFHPNINVIIGSSDRGKTSILRGLHSVRYNRPMGLAMVSRWAKTKTKKGIVKIKDNHCVEVGLKDHTVLRIRNKDYNGYEIWDEESSAAGAPLAEIEAIGSDVPEQIENLFNINEVNIQKQMDGPFLISESPPEVARFFNKTIRLDLIDKVLGNAENKRKQNNKEIKKIKAEIEDLEGKIKDLDWVENAENALIIAERRQGSIDRSKDKKEECEEILELLTSHQQIVDKFSFLDEAEKILDEAKVVDEKIDDDVNEMNDLIDFIEKYELSIETVKSFPDFKNADKLMKEALTIHILCEDTRDEMDELKTILSSHKDNNDIYAEMTKDIIALEEEMPDLCPTCEQPFMEKR